MVVLMVVLELMVVLMVLMVLLTTPGQVGADSRGHGAHRRRGDWGVKTCQFMQYLSNHIKPHHRRHTMLHRTTPDPPPQVTRMAAKIKANPSIVPKLQGVTGREEARLIGDHCLEGEGYGREEGVEGEEQEEQEVEEVDEDGYVVYGAVKAEEYVMPEEKKKKKTKGGKAGEEEAEAEVWSQEEQRALEQALALFPKVSAERWERIAAKVT